MNTMQYAENRKHSTELIPFSYYESKIPDYFPNVPLHCHKEFEINHIISGQGEFIVGDNRFTADEGDVVIIQPNILHSVCQKSNDTVRYDTIVFSENMLLSASFDRSTTKLIEPIKEHKTIICPKITSDNSDYIEAADLVSKLFEAAKKNTPIGDLIIKSCLLGLFALLLSDEKLVHIGSDEMHMSELIRPSVEYMGEHFAERITIAELAAISHMSGSYFMKIFRQYAGMSAVEYLNQIRLKRVCELLKDRSDSICDIAFACGFSNLSNFNRQFRRQFGITPREYEKAINKQP